MLNDLFLLDAMALLVGLLFFFALFLFRNFASLVLPRLQVSLAPAQPPEGFAAAFAQTEAELRELGFTPFCWLNLMYIGQARSVLNTTQVFHHRDGCTYALVQMPVDVNRPDALVVGLGCELADDSALVTFRRMPFEPFFATPQNHRQSMDSDVLAEVYAAHRDAMHAQGAAALPLPKTPATMAAESERAFQRHCDSLIRHGTAWQDRAGHIRLRVAAIFRAMGFARRLRTLPPNPIANVTLAAQSAMLPLFEQQRENAPAAGMQWALLLLTTALFVFAAALLFDAKFALVLALALVLHEGGHYLAMRALGYRNVQMVLLPLLGGVTTGVETDPHGTRRALVSLMGPLPGIVLGWLLVYGALSGSFDMNLNSGGLFSFGFEEGLRAGIILLVLNYLNLLPFPPLDGGHFVQSLLPHRWRGAEAWLLGALVGLGVFVAWQLQWWIVIMLFALQFGALRQHWRDARLLRALEPVLTASHGTTDRTGGDTRQLDMQLLAAVAKADPQASMAQRLARVVRLRTLVRLRPPSLLVGLALLGVYVAAFAVPLLFPQVRQLLAPLLAF